MPKEQAARDGALYHDSCRWGAVKEPYNAHD